MMTDLEELIRAKQDKLRGRPEDWIDRFGYWRRRIDWVTVVTIGTLAFTVIAMTTIAASAQQSPPNRARYYYGGEPHVGPASVGSMYDGRGNKIGQSYTHSDGNTTIYGADGRVMGRTAIDSQGTTTFYDAGGRVTGRAVPDGGR
jgi:YD repeat-containing protein